MSLKGKVALVTGGSRGIGRAISLQLASEGADIIINFFRKRSTAEATVKEIEAKGVRAHASKANVGEPEEIGELVNYLANMKGSFHTGTIIKFAGGWPAAPKRPI